MNTENTPDQNQNTNNHNQDITPMNNDNSVHMPDNSIPHPTTSNPDFAKDPVHSPTPVDSPANGPDPGAAKPAKTKKEIKLYRAIEATIALGNKVNAFLAPRPYLTESVLFFALENLFTENVIKFSNPELIELFRKANAHRIVKKTWDQYYHHLKAFSKKMNKPFWKVTAVDVSTYIKTKTIKEGEGDTVVQSVHDHLVNVFNTFFEWLLDQGYYPRVFRNPVSLRRFTNRRRAPSAIYIFSHEEYQLLLSAVPWYAVPALVCLFKLGIRPETVDRLSWSDFDFKRRVVKVSSIINKSGSACPVLTESDMALLEPWRHCTGPVVVFSDTLKQIREIAKELGIRDDFHDDPRKTAISMRAGMLRELHPIDVEGKLDYEFSNSKEVRRVFYEIHREAADAIAYDACTRPLPDTVLTLGFARGYRLAQFRSAVRVAMAISERERKHTFTTPLPILEKLRRKALKNAWESLSLADAFPSFAKIQGVVDLTKHHYAKLVERMGRDVSQVLASYNERYANDEEQTSLFHGKGELFLPETKTISEECPIIPPPSSTNSSSPSDTESPSEQ